jgi:hypothetical protein
MHKAGRHQKWKVGETEVINPPFVLSGLTDLYQVGRLIPCALFWNLSPRIYSEFESSCESLVE